MTIFDAIRKKDMKSLRELIQLDCNLLNSQDEYGMYPISAAIGHQNFDALKILLESGASPNPPMDSIPEPHRNPTLAHAALVGRSRMFWLLLEYGADIDVPSVSGKTALHWLCKKGFNDEVEELIRRGADINKWDKSGFPPIVYAIQHKQPLTARILVEHGAETDIINKQGISLRELAKNRGLNVEAIFKPL